MNRREAIRAFLGLPVMPFLAEQQPIHPAVRPVLMSYSGNDQWVDVSIRYPGDVTIGQLADLEKKIGLWT